jgi:hypothetical protein
MNDVDAFERMAQRLATVFASEDLDDAESESPRSLRESRGSMGRLVRAQPVTFRFTSASIAGPL